ncbi:MAG: ThuA domain-containing protein [Gammaproteobacteria bacterium]|nr:ThuA domain-containing protein [Gammaproteobacteria bacterium]
MNSGPINGYLVCGGLYHDMDFARLELLKLFAEHERIRVRVGEDYRDRDAIAAADFLVTYTCNVVPKPEEVDALSRFLGAGRRWLALHGTNSLLRFVKGRGWDAPQESPRFMEMLGSRFLAHPPIAPFRVEISNPDHPLVAGIEPFDADDELYLCEYLGEVEPLLHTRYRGEAPGFVAGSWPLPRAAGDGARDAAAADRQLVMYLRRHGGGEVLYCTLGHCRGKYDMRPMIAEYPAVERGSWKLPVYRELLRRGLRWAAGPAF